MRNSVVSIGIVALLLFSTIGLNAVSSTMNVTDDFDPLVDLEITVNILKIRSLEKKDLQVYTEEIIDEHSDPDFYMKVMINDQDSQALVYDNTKYVYEPDWTVTANVPDDTGFVDIRIQLWDQADNGDT
jgi:hypothetical protein